MFTGLIRHRGHVSATTTTATGLRLTLSVPVAFGKAGRGDSIAVNGTCLTAVEDARMVGDRQVILFDAIPETLSLSTLGFLVQGDTVHVESSARVGDPVHGHVVQGHVDGIAVVREIDTSGGGWRVRLEVPAPLAVYLAPKGSVALDGVSLTVAGITGNLLEAALIPTTLAETELGKWSVGRRVNIECDAVAKQIVRYLMHFSAGAAHPSAASALHAGR